MSCLLTITRAHQVLAFNPPIKLVVDGRDRYTLNVSDVLQIPLSPEAHTLEFSAMLRKKSVMIQTLEDMTLTLSWNKITGALEAETAAPASAAPAADAPPERQEPAGWQENVRSAQQSLKGLWGNLKDEALKLRQDAAVRAAYKREEEKRKPRTEKIEHRRELTPQEQQTIDLAELERSRFYQDFLANKMSLKEYQFRSTTIKLKIREIQDRAVWYETIEYPPEIDPSVPIVIDEEAIRASIK